MRSRRGGSVTSSATSLSSTSSTEASGTHGMSMFAGSSGMDLESIAEQVFEHLSITGSDPDTLQASSYSDLSSAHSQDGIPKKQDGGQKKDGGRSKQDGCRSKQDGCQSKQDGCRTKQDGRRTPRLKARVPTPSIPTFKQDGRLCLNFVDAISGAPNRTYYKLFRGILSWINPDLNVFVCSEKTQCFSHDHELNDHLRPQKKTVDIPDLAVVLFLQEELTSGDGSLGKMSQVKEFFQHKPWRFHHSEWVGQGRIQACPQSNHDYFFVKHDLPLCSVRQIHCGEEHIRLVRFITAAHWKDSLKLYSLLLGQEPDAMKQDFCLFTVEKFADVDLQLALKKLPKGIEPRHTRKCVLSFKVKDIGYLVPLLPHACIRIAEHRWKTHDLDRNEIHILVEDTSPKPIRAPMLRHSRPKSHSRSGHVRQFSSSSDSQTSIQSCSAFTPVHGSIDQIQNSDPGSKLSPRVYLNKDIPEEVVSKVQNGLSLQNRTREVYSPMLEQEYEHQHTDSGFMDERSDDSTDNRAHLQLYTQVQVHADPDFNHDTSGLDYSTNSSVPDSSTHIPVPDPCTKTLVSDSSIHDPVPNQKLSATNTQDTSADYTTNSNQNSCSCDTKLSATDGLKKIPLCHSSPKSDHHSASPTWDTDLGNSIQDTNVQNKTQDNSVSGRRDINTQDANVNTHALDSMQNNSENPGRDSNDTYVRTSTQDTTSAQDTHLTSCNCTTQDTGIAEYHSNPTNRVASASHEVLHSQPLPPCSNSNVITNWNTDYAVSQNYGTYAQTHQVNSDLKTKPQLPSYQEAVNLLAAKRQQADLRSAKLMQVSDQMNDVNPNEPKYTSNVNSDYYTGYEIPPQQSREAHCDDEEAKEGEPETDVQPSCTSILSDARRGPFQRRTSSNGKRVRFNDVNENFTYEPIEMELEGVSQTVEQESDDVFLNDRVANRAEGSECIVRYDEESAYNQAATDNLQKYTQNITYGGSLDLHWYAGRQAEADSGFYI